MKSKFRRFNDHSLNRIGLLLIILFLLASSRPMLQDSGEKFPNIYAISSRVEVIGVDTSPPSIELISPEN